MHKLISLIHKILVIFGVNPKIMSRAILNIPSYIQDYMIIKRQLKNSRTAYTKINIFPCLNDKAVSSGIIDGHYFHQDLLVAQKIFVNKPIHHVDIGSRVDGFVAHIAAFRSIEVFDIRPAPYQVHNISFRQLDFMQPLPEELRNYTDSASCLHALEHFGLGRYGDRIELNGHINGFDNLCSILKQRGKLYLSIPIGETRIEFNAHRVFSLEYLIKLFQERFTIDSFSYIDDSGDIHTDIPLQDSIISNNAGCHYGCGVFELTKI